MLQPEPAGLPEVVGDAALTVDPYDISALVQAIQAMDRDELLRARLAQAGPQRAALFSAERYAARLGDLYARLGVLPATQQRTPTPFRMAV